MIKLHYAPNTCSLASIVVMEELGLNYELALVDFSITAQRSEAYLKINPYGRVPALETPEGVFTETPAILGFLSQRYGQGALAPSDAAAYAQMQAFNSFLCSTVHVAHAHRMRGYRWADEPEAIEAMQRKAPEAVTDAFAHIETHLLGSPWVLGRSYSIADAYLFTLAQWLEADRADTSRLPRVIAHRAQMLARPGVLQALKREAAGR